MQVFRKVASAVAGGIVASALIVGVAAPAGASNIGQQGCTPGYWKNHTEAWAQDPTDHYSPTQTLDELFDFPDELASFRTVTLLAALDGGGGSGATGGAAILMRAAVAAFNNAAAEDIGYPYRRFDEPGNMLAKINAALASLDKQQMVDYAAVLDAANNLGCPR
jgi:hypothetical protein